jgi:hypothetical protein
MKKMSILIVVVLGLTLIAGVVVADSQELKTKVGIVTGFSKKWLTIKDDEGKDYNFRVGRATSYQPERYPKVGERVEVRYGESKGIWVGYVVTILPSQ